MTAKNHPMSSETPPETLTTKYHRYFFNDKEDTDWLVLRARLKKTHDLFEVIGDAPEIREADIPITLETSTVFNNQWNAVIGDKGLRVFDWYLVANRPHSVLGQYLDITEEMIDLRKNTWSCGYCGSQCYKPPEDYRVCDRCLGSEYLKESDLDLLQLLPVSESRTQRRKLSPEEMAKLIPLYREAAISGNAERKAAEIDKSRAAVIDRYQKTITRAKVEHDNKIWFLDHGYTCGNIIYYSHTGITTLGWQTPYDEKTGLELRLRLHKDNCPFVLELKAQDGTWSRNPEENWTK